MSRLVLPSFAGGLWLTAEGREHAIPADALLKCDNLEFLFSGGLQGRRGRTIFSGSALPGPIRALWRHYPRTGTKNTLAFVDVGATVEAWSADDDSGTFALATAALPDDAFWDFANWPAKNKTFITSTGGGLRQWDGTNVTAVTASGTNEVDLTNLGPYLTVHKSRIFTPNIDELNYSIYASEVNDETTFLSDSHLSLNDPQGGRTTGLVGWNDFLILFKEGSLFRFVGDVSSTLEAQLGAYTDRGCVAPNSIAVTPYGLIYVGRQGVYITEGTSPNPPELSLPIRPLFISRSSQQNYPNAVGRWYQNKQMYVLKLNPLEEDAYVLQRIEVLAENPYVDSRSRVAWIWWHHTSLLMDAATVWESETDDGRLITGDSIGRIHRFDDGSDDDGNPITATMQTAAVPIDNSYSRNPENSAQMRSGRVKWLRLKHRASNPLTGEVLYDHDGPFGGAAFLVGTDTDEEKFSRAPIADQELIGKFVSFWIENPASDETYEIHMIDAITRLKNRRVWRDDTDQPEGEVVETQGSVTITGTNTEAAVTFGTVQPNTSYYITFGVESSTGIGPSTVGIKPGTKATTGFTAEVGGAPGTGNTYTIHWHLARAS